MTSSKQLEAIKRQLYHYGIDDAHTLSVFIAMIKIYGDLRSSEAIIDEFIEDIDSSLISRTLEADTNHTEQDH